MERNLFKYILKHSMRDQVLILIVVAVSLAFYYVSLDLPKTIVNAIQHLTGHPEKMTTFMHLEFGLPGFLGGGRPERRWRAALPPGPVPQGQAG